MAKQTPLIVNNPHSINKNISKRNVPLIICFINTPKIFRSLTLVLLITVLLVSCRNQSRDASLKLNGNLPGLSPGEGNVRLIFFNMYLPTEMTHLFEKAGANYNPSLMNPPEVVSRYTSPHSIAVNLGVYGVDLNYAKLYNQNQEVAKYISSVKILASKLGIPHDYYEELLISLEKYYGEKDSITRIATDIYSKTDEYLKAKNKNSYAALIVLGGWVEALYIATKIYENDPTKIGIMERITEQKYSLNNLISLLSNYEDDITIVGYILMLKTLKKSFDQFQILYKPEKLTIDSLNNIITTTGFETEIPPHIIKEISHIISGIRSEFVM